MFLLWRRFGFRRLVMFFVLRLAWRLFRARRRGYRSAPAALGGRRFR
jgi:hypothetical protein